MNATSQYRVRFDGISQAEANQAAVELSALLEQRGLEPEIVRDSDDTQDFGATLVLVLGTPAVVALVKAVHTYIAKRGNRVSIEMQNGTILASGDAASNVDVAQVVKALGQQGDE